MSFGTNERMQWKAGCKGSWRISKFKIIGGIEKQPLIYKSYTYIKDIYTHNIAM